MPTSKRSTSRKNDIRAIESLAEQDRADEVDDSYARTGDAQDTIRRWHASARSAGDHALVDTINRMGLSKAAAAYEAARRSNPHATVRRSPNLDLNNWLDSHGYRHSHARKQEPARRPPVLPAKSCKCPEPWVTRERTTPCRTCGGAVEGDADLPGHARIIHQAPTGRPVFAAHERDHHITTSGRRVLDRGQFALPPSPEEKRRGIKGRLPIDTIARARNALQRARQMQKRRHLTVGQLEEVQRTVHKAWPSIKVTRHSHATVKGKLGKRSIHLMREVAEGRNRIFYMTDTPVGFLQAERAGFLTREPSTDRAILTDSGRKFLVNATSVHAAIAKGGPSNVRLGDKFRHEGGIWAVTRISGSKITMTSETSDPRDPFNFEKFILIERTWPQNALRKMTKISH